MSDLEDILDRPTFNQTALRILLDNVRSVRENTTRAVSALETVLYLNRPPDQGDTLKQMLGVSLFGIIINDSVLPMRKTWFSQCIEFNEYRNDKMYVHEAH